MRPITWATLCCPINRTIGLSCERNFTWICSTHKNGHSVGLRNTIDASLLKVPVMIYRHEEQMSTCARDLVSFPACLSTTDERELWTFSSVARFTRVCGSIQVRQSVRLACGIGNCRGLITGHSWNMTITPMCIRICHAGVKVNHKKYW